VRQKLSSESGDGNWVLSVAVGKKEDRSESVFVSVSPEAGICRSIS
jgi:hypothetical protein